MLFDLNVPPGLLTYGLRDYLLEKIKSVDVGGTIRRTVSDASEQCITLSLIGVVEAHQKLITDVLEKAYFGGQLYWNYEIQNHKDQWFSEMGARTISITRSQRGAARGENSDKQYDNRSEKSSSQKSSEQSSKKSSKTSQTSHLNQSLKFRSIKMLFIIMTT